MWIIFGVVIVVLIIVLISKVLLSPSNTSVNNASNNKKTAEKANNPIIKERSYPWFYVKDCKFYADTTSLFSYDQKDLDFLLEKYEEYEKTADYDEIIKVCDEIIAVNYTIRKVWVDKINALFNIIIKEGKEWDEGNSKLVVNACYGFMKTFDNVMEKSIGVKHILLPILLKNVNNIVEYQRKNLSELYNFEVYNMLINLFYLMPFHQILDAIYRYLTEDKFLKNFEKNEYAKRSIKSFAGHLEMLKSRYKVEQIEYNLESTYKVKINDTVIVNDEIFNTTWIGFSVIFPRDINRVELTCKFYDDRFQEIFLEPSMLKRYSDLFESSKKGGGLEEFEIVILGEDLIKAVDLSLYHEDDGNNLKQQIFATDEKDDVDNLEKPEIKVKEEQTKQDTKLNKIEKDKDATLEEQEIEVNDNAQTINEEEKEVHENEQKVSSYDKKQEEQTQEDEKQEEQTQEDEKQEDQTQENKEEFQNLSLPDFTDIKQVAISELHFICLKNDGSVQAYGENSKLIDVNEWKNIEKIYVTNAASYGLKRNGTMVVADKSLYNSSEVTDLWKDVVELAPAYNHMLGLKKDGTVLAIGDNENGQCNVSDWTNVKSISVNFHSVGLTNDGVVFATGENKFGECNVDKWTNIVQIETGPFYTVGLKADGTVVSTGLNSCGQCNVSEWKNIKSIYVKGNITVGLGFDGKVLVTGSNSYRFEDIKKWTDIKDIKIVNDRIIGIKENGTVVYKGKPYRGTMERDWNHIKDLVANSNCVVGLREDGSIICNNILFGMYIPGVENMPLDIKKNDEIEKVVVLNKDKTINVYNKNTNNAQYNWDCSRFNDISSIALSETHLVGIKTDGTAVLTGTEIKMTFDVESWRNLIKVELGQGFCIGLKIDGKVVATGDNFFGQCNVSWWNDIVDIKVAGFRTFGLKADGTVVFTGFSEYEEQEFVKLFDDIVEIAANKKQLMLLDSNGNIKISKHPDGISRTKLSDWINLKHILTIGEDFIGLKEDGTVVSTFEDESGLRTWAGIKELKTNDMYILGKKVNYTD